MSHEICTSLNPPLPHPFCLCVRSFFQISFLLLLPENLLHFPGNRKRLRPKNLAEEKTQLKLSSFSQIVAFVCSGFDALADRDSPTLGFDWDSISLSYIRSLTKA